MKPVEAVVKAVKKSAVRKGTYYLIVEDAFGEIKVLATKSYKIGDIIKIKRKKRNRFYMGNS